MNPLVARGEATCSVGLRRTKARITLRPLRMAASESIRLRGVRQNNLKGFDLDVPLGQYVVVTGLSGAGKSSLVFETLHAEGQRRYVETFSAYTRQFLELLPKPRVDSIENIRPSIAIEQSNTVKTSRSTVGTMTELCDYAKVWFSHVAECFDPATGEKVEDDNPQTIWRKARAALPDGTVLVAFRIRRPANLSWAEILQNLQAQSYLRVLLPAAAGATALQRIADLLTEGRPLAALDHLFVVQDRTNLADDGKARFIEAVETALHFGQGEVHLFRETATGGFTESGHYSRGLHSPTTDRRFRPATPALFSFNSPLGACPKCRGFGRVIEIDYRLAIPDRSLSIDAGAVKCWEGEIYGESKRDLLVFAKKKRIPTNLPFADLSPVHQAFVIDGEPGYGANGVEWPKAWYGLKGFFRYLEARTYKMHVRIFLSRYRAYNPCPECGATRLQPEALCWKWFGHTLPALYALPVADLLALLRDPSSLLPPATAELPPPAQRAPALPDSPPANLHSASGSVASAQEGIRLPQSGAHTADLAFEAILTRLRYLEQVGLGYLTLDRQSRTLSGGEVERVNLTSCLGSSLVDTLFVLDEPSVGLHPRDIDRLIGIVRSLTSAGNTVVVVEHDEAMIRAADHVIEIGPEPGAAGGYLVFQGNLPALLASRMAITGDYLSGRRAIELPARRRPVTPPAFDPPVPVTCHVLSDNFSEPPPAPVPSVAPAHPIRVNLATKAACNVLRDNLPDSSSESSPGDMRPPTVPGVPDVWLEFVGVSKHNIRDLSFRLPLRRLVGLSGVSGSGKSTLLDHVVYQGLLAARRLFAEDPASIAAIHGAETLGEVVLVDQSPLSRTPRSNPVLYAEAWEYIRELFASTEAAREAGFTASSFSFNAGDGRCEHCQGLGYEAVEMQFLSDVYVQCPVCEGRRFKPEVLACKWAGRSVAEVLSLTVQTALAVFAEEPAIRTRLAPLDEVGLGYLALGQPLNTLSGGEAQRLKLVKYLGSFTADAGESAVRRPPSAFSGALLLLDEPTTGLHRHDVKRLLEVLQRLVDCGHSVVVIEHNTDVLKSADWILEVGPGAGAGGGRIVAEGPPEAIATTNTATAPYLRAALAQCGGLVAEGGLLAAEPEVSGAPSSTSVASVRSVLSVPFVASDAPPSAIRPPQFLEVIGARENNLRNLSVSIPHHEFTVVTGVSGSGKSTLAFDIVFAEGQRRFMESLSAYARQFVEQLPRPAVDRLTGIPPTVAIEQRVTRGGRKSTVATITEVAQYLRLLYAKLGVQHHPDSDEPIRALSNGELEKLFAAALRRPALRRAKHLYLCAPLVRGRKGHHQPVADWIRDHGYPLMRADGRLTLVENFSKLDRFKEHDVEVVVADLMKPETGDRNPETSSRKKAAGTASRAVHRSGVSSLPSLFSGLRSPVSLLSEALRLGKGSCFLLRPDGGIVSWFSTTRTDVATGESFPELDPKHFSFNSPTGWCPVCRGHGILAPWMFKPEDDEDETPPEIAELAHLFADQGDAAFQPQTCPECGGARLNKISRAVKLHFRRGAPLSLPALLAHTPAQLLARLRDLALDRRGELIVQDLRPQIEERLKFMDEVGLGYLALERATDTLSGGEAQRIRLAAQLGSNLSGVLYVLDEPSIGLHARDNDRLVVTLQALRAKGNTLLVVEHDEVVMDAADRIIDLGPGAGRHGGQILANDTPANLRKNANSLTGVYLDRGIPHPIRGAYRTVVYRAQPPSAGTARRSVPASAQSKIQNPKSEIAWLTLTGARMRNLRAVDLRLPLGRLVMVAGPSGAGKSTLFRDLLGPAVTQAIKQKKSRLTGAQFVRLSGAPGVRNQSKTENRKSKIPPPFSTLCLGAAFRSVIEVDQSPIGHTPRSTPATYLGVFDLVRQFLATLPESKIRGYTASRFSFNTAGGRCEACSGAGRIKLEMNFMPDTFVTCDACGGRRYGPETLAIEWRGKNVADLLALTFEEACSFFDFHARLKEVCRLMCETGLGYLTLGQSSPTLSGGEAQRLKLVTELAHGLQTYQERSRGIQPRNLYLLEEPTIGLHLSDCEKLIHLLHRLVDQGHTVVVIEHHLDLLAEADWLVELGPGGGPDGGEILYQGPVAGIVKCQRSPTAPYLRAKLGHDA